MQAYFDQNQTYVGATLPAGSGVVLASADATSYCLQDGSEHEVGPGGTPQPGACSAPGAGCERRHSGERWYAAAVRFQLRLSAAKRASSRRPCELG